MKERAGILRKNLYGEMLYQSFLPAPLPPDPDLHIDSDMMNLLIKANKQLAYLDGVASQIPNMELFITMYVRKEALLSSQIEGTQATLEDVLDPTIDSNANLEVADVINYIEATDFALSRFEELPLCNRLIQEAHAVLMQGVRGQEKSPGEFRTSQNWIGGQGSTLKNAKYIPPSPEDMIIAMSDLEKYMNDDNDDLDPLIKAALIHYQFETIHPFLDGNGRVGRLLITLYLLDKGLLKTPVLYISYYLKSNRIEYYDRMSEVRRKGNYEQWVAFFLQAIYESAEDAVQTIQDLTKVCNEDLDKIRSERWNATQLTLFQYLQRNPIVEIQKTAADLNLTYNTISKAVQIFIEKNILMEAEKTGRARTFVYKRYLDVLKRDTL